MEKRNVVRYIFFGTSLRYLQDAREGWLVHSRGGILENLDIFLDYVAELGLTVTQRTDAHADLIRLADEMHDDPDEDALLTMDLASRLARAMTEIRLTLMAEAMGNIAYVTTEKRIEVAKLLDDVRSLLTPETFDKLPEIAQLDFGEAGKCIAFERPTAAAFHLLRGTEEVLREYYRHTVRRNRVNPLLWHSMTQHLARRRNPPASPLLENLNNIRTSFRNPTQHPEKVYDIDEVQDLFGLCVDVVRRMAASL
jgi:hypothetical protein